MENKPIVTCHGDQTLFSKLHPLVVQGLPREQVEWRRSFGRPPRTIRTEATFVPFNPDILPGEEDQTLLGRPFFHTYWTDCDIDNYKAGVKEDIADWVAALKVKGHLDWLIVIVTNDESKVKNKILRQSVYDKVKSDFCSKQAERCVALHEPFKTDSKTSESWSQVLQRIRSLLLDAYNRCLNRFEDHMRTQREKRQEDGWTFNQYFLLQEELAFMFEMLCLYEDALVQYDELDALFTQFILNHAAGATAGWLTNLSQNDSKQWDGIDLSQPINIEKRLLIRRGEASLLDFRNYLFSRQCTLLLLLVRPWEVAQRAIPFMHNCLQEMKILQLTLPPGALPCWIFLSCLEVLKTLERFQKSGQMEEHSLYTANLWDYARVKLVDAVNSCDIEAAGGPENPLAGSDKYTPADELIKGATPQGLVQEGSLESLEKLKEALSSKIAFRKHYMDLSELAMGTYKHIGRLRSARLIGKDLAHFYIRQEEPEKAESLLIDSLKIFKKEGWELLAANTRLEIAKCQSKSKNNGRYVKSCIHICGSNLLDRNVRLKYFKDMLEIANTERETPVYVHAEPIFNVTNIVPTHTEFNIHQKCYVTLEFDAELPDPISIDSIEISLMQFDNVFNDTSSVGSSSSRRKRHYSDSSYSSRGRHGSFSSATGLDFFSRPSLASKQSPAVLDMKVVATGLQCKTPLHRIESGTLLLDTEVKKEDFSLNLMGGERLEVKQGHNVVNLEGKIPESGNYTMCQLCIKLGNLEFIKSLSSADIGFDVLEEEPEVTLCPISEPILAGMPQSLRLILSTGSVEFPHNALLTVHPSEGLIFSCAKMTNQGINVGGIGPADSCEFECLATTELKAKAGETIQQYEIQVKCEEVGFDSTVLLPFQHPFRLSHKIHSSATRKYVQVVVHGTCAQVFRLSGHSLNATTGGASFKMINPPHQELVVDDAVSGSYMWELCYDTDDSPEIVDCSFNMQYQLENGDKYPCNYNFSLENYKTLFKIETSLPPTGEKENHYKMGFVYELGIQLNYEDGDPDPERKFMYDIIAEPNTWAVCGKSSGVFTMESTQHKICVDIVPLTPGFLHLPVVRLSAYQIKLHIVEEKDTGRVSPATVTPLHSSQVFNATLGLQVRVNPAVVTSDTAVSVEQERGE